TGTVREWAEYSDARVFVHSLGLGTQLNWLLFIEGAICSLPRLPDNIPRKPNLVYAKEWKSWNDWLGPKRSLTLRRTGKQRAPCREFNAARDFARTLNLNGLVEWYAYIFGLRGNLPRLPADIPSHPYYTYRKSGWKGWGDFLGTGHQTHGV